MTLLLPCDQHADRPGTLTVDLPSLGIKLYKCEECAAAQQQRINEALAAYHQARFDYDRARGYKEGRYCDERSVDDRNMLDHDRAQTNELNRAKGKDR